MASASIFGRVPKVEVNYVPHPGQDEVSEALAANFQSITPASIIEIICGRGWGKTLYMACDILVPFLDQHPGAKVMWVAPTYLVCMSLIEDVFKAINETSGKQYIPKHDGEGNQVWEFVTTKSGSVLKWYNGAEVTFRSADSPDSIVSRGFNLIIIDEACLIADEKIFTLQILGTARKAGIKIFMISTPRGKKHWTYKYFLKGQDAKETMYLSFTQPFDKNPYYSKVLEQLIKDIPEWVYRQEYMAEFIEDGDSVFRGIEHVLFGNEISFEGQQQEWELPLTDIKVKTLTGEYKREAADRRFVVGLDLAKSIDYTVLWTMDIDTGDLVYYRRLNKMDYRDVLRISTDVCKKFNHAELIFDATGVGAGLADVLNNYDVIAHPYVFTNESKNEIVNKLSLSIQYQEIKIPNIVTVKNELSVFTYTITRTGKISYNAPSGFHDDIVMALALANWYRKENVGSEDIAIVEDIMSINEERAYHRPGSMAEYMHEDND